MLEPVNNSKFSLFGIPLYRGMKYITIITVLFVLFTGCKKEEPQQRYIPQYPQSPLPRMHSDISEAPPQQEQWKTKNFRGEWVTVKNRRLDGIMDCTVTRVGQDKYTGRFWGTWHGVDYDYTVNFNGPLSNLVGEPCTIDGASYTWKGRIVDEVFKAEFTGSRYTGSFDLKER